MKTNTAKLVGTAMEYPVLSYLMVHGKLIAAKGLAAVTDAVQESGSAEYASAIHEYGDSAAPSKKTRRELPQRWKNVMKFLFDTTGDISSRTRCIPARKNKFSRP